MKPELDRVKNDLETMQKALGLAPSISREWIQWMKRDQWLGLWWCLPGLILIAAALFPLPHARRYGGLVFDQWTGLLVCAIILGMTAFQMRKITATDGRPEGLIRELKRTNGMTTQGLWFAAACVLQALLYAFWCSEYRIGFEPFWAGFFILTGSTYLVAAMAARAWLLLGWAIPFLGYGLCLPLAQGHGKVNGILLGMMFIAVALSFSFIAVLKIRFMERQNVAD
jgi:hypothetical protein